MLRPSPFVYARTAAFKEAVRSSGTTQQAAARHAGVNATVLSEWLHGRRELRRDAAAVLAFVLGVPLDEIAEDSTRCPNCGSAVAA